MRGFAANFEEKMLPAEQKVVASKAESVLK